MIVEFKQKIKKNIDGSEYVSLPKEIKSNHVMGQKHYNEWDRKSALHHARKAGKLASKFLINDLPEYVTIDRSGFLAVVTVTVTERGK